MGADVVNIGGDRRKKVRQDQPVLVKRTMSVSDLIRDCNTAVEVMSPGNPHRLLIINCANVMRGLCERLARLEPSAEPVSLNTADVMGTGTPDGASDGK